MSVTLPTAESKARSPRVSMRRLRALARAELKLILRNRMALFMTLAMPVGAAFLFAGLDVAERSEISLGASTFLMVTSFAILFVVYYNLVAAYAARREDLVLKRLRTGELTDGEILAGTASASVLVALAQVAVIAVAAPLLFEMSAPVNPILVVLGVLGAAVVFVPLAAASSVFTKNAEMAQLTTLPIIMVCMMFSGFVFPLSIMPDGLVRAAELLPLSPAVELMRIGLLGETMDGATVEFATSFRPALWPVVVLVAWTGIGQWLVRRYFRWEPRR